MSITTGIRNRLGDAFQDAVLELAHDILEAAERDAPPSPPPDEDPNEAVTLREAGYVERLPGRGVEIGFRTSYAAKQHENFRLKHPHGGKPKFLERNVAAAAAQMEGRIALQLRKVMAHDTVVSAPRLPKPESAAPARPAPGDQVTYLVNDWLSAAGVR